MRSPGNADSTVVIGKLGAPWGVKGDLKVQSYSGEFGHFLSLREVELVWPEGQGLAAAPSRPAGPSDRSRPPAPAAPARRSFTAKIARVEDRTEFLTMAFVGYTSPEAARALTGMELRVPRSAAAPLRDNEWYVSDLIVLALVAGGERRATVASVLEGGPEPWLEALLPGGRVALVPFRKEFVGEVDLDAGSIELLAPWLLDE